MSVLQSQCEPSPPKGTATEEFIEECPLAGTQGAACVPVGWVNETLRIFTGVAHEFE